MILAVFLFWAVLERHNNPKFPRRFSSCMSKRGLHDVNIESKHTNNNIRV